MAAGTKIIVGVSCVLLAVGAGWGATVFGRKAVEGVVHDYILEHPEILPQAMENLQNRENAKQLADVSSAVEAPFPGAVLGNPDGKVTLVEFSDFACGYCRKSLGDVEALIARNPDLRIVVRELPIISEHSPEASRWGLAAAQQGKFAQFHKAMFEAGQIDPQTIQATARSIGLDMAKAAADAKSPAVEAELQRNFAIASRLGFTGTPSWVAGERLIQGAVGFDQLAEAVESARKR